MIPRIVAAGSVAVSLTLAGCAAAPISVRESFAAAAQQDKPASFLVTVEETPTRATFASIDAAARYAFERGVVIGGPTLEWHKLTREGKEYDRILLGGFGELRVPPLEIPWLGTPYFTTQIGFERDLRADSTSLAYSFAGTFFSQAAWAPGKQNGLWPNSMLRYYPYIAVERHAAVLPGGGSALLGVLQLNVELWPLVGRVQLLGSYATPRDLGDDELPDDLSRASVSLNVYLDSGQRVAFGIDFIDAAQPKNGFQRSERTVLGFKAKL